MTTPGTLTLLLVLAAVVPALLATGTSGFSAVLDPGKHARSWVKNRF